MNVNIHKVTQVKAIVSEPREDVMGRIYHVTKILIDTEHGPECEVTLFGAGREVDDHETDTQVQVYPFVEIERPDV